MTDCGPIEWVLGMHVQYDRENRVLKIDQEQYITSVAKRFGLDNRHPVDTPLTPTQYDVLMHKSHKNKAAGERYVRPEEKLLDPKGRQLFQQKVGSALYAVRGTRPDGAAAVNMVSRALQSPTEAHMAMIDRIIVYMYSTRHFPMTYAPNAGNGPVVTAYCDSNYAAREHDSRSRGGGCIKLTEHTVPSAVVTWWTKLLTVKTSSSTGHSEYVSANKEADVMYHIRKQLQNFGFRQRVPSELYVDSKTARMWAMNPSTEHKTRAIRTKDHRIRDYIRRKVIKVMPIAGVNNPADLYTKIVKDKKSFQRHTSVFMNKQDFIDNRQVMMNLSRD